MAHISLLCVIFCSTSLFTMSWGFGHNLNIPKNYSIIQQNANINNMKTLSYWQEHREEFVLHSKHKEVVLVMGNIGSGKSTLVSALTGQKLRAIRKYGDIAIVDEEGRIGTDSFARTLVPEVMIDNERNVIYIDCAGFNGNHGVEHEISSFNILNSLMNHVEKIKLILVINYDSLKDTGNRNDFDYLFEYVGEFIKDISKFHDGIALVATKVSDVYRRSDNGTFVLLNDNQVVIDGIADYLKNKQETYLDKPYYVEKYRMLANLIDVLLENKDDLYTRIAIFRVPSEPGLLDDMPETKSEINTIAKMISKNLKYVAKQKDDFSFALSTSSKKTIDQRIDHIFRNNLTNLLYEIGNETLTHYLQMEKQHSDIETLSKQVSYAYDLISEIKNVDTPEGLFDEFLHVTNILNISVSQAKVNMISDNFKKLRYYKTFSNKNEDVHMLFLQNKMQTVINSIENLSNLYNFLIDLEENLAAYNSQKLKNNHFIENILESCANSTSKIVHDIPDLENIVKAIGSHQIFQEIKTLKLNRFQLKHLAAIFRAFTSKLEFLCSTLSKFMIVKGYNVKISDVDKIHCSKQVESLQIFALNKVFIDQTINKTGAETQLFIFAPTWVVIGTPKIILDGKAGELLNKTSSASASSNSFFGIGKQFINLTYLEIHINGDSRRQLGENGAGLLFKINQDSKDVNKYFNRNANDRKHSITKTTLSLHSAINFFKAFVRVNLYENIRESALRTFLYELENDGRIKAQYNTFAFVEEFEELENQFLELRNKIDLIPFYNSLLFRVQEYDRSKGNSKNTRVLSYLDIAASEKLISLNKNMGHTVVNLTKYLDNIEKSARYINETYFLQIVQQYQNDYENIFNRKIEHANNFIQNTIEPELDKLRDEFNNQMEAIVNEINKSRNSTENTLETIKKNQNKIRDLIQLYTAFLPLKFAASTLSFFKFVGIMVTVTITNSTLIAERVHFNTTFSRGVNKIYSREDPGRQPPSFDEQNIERENQNRLCLLNDAQSTSNGAETMYRLIRKVINEEGMIRKTNDQIFLCAQQLGVLKNMEYEMYDMIRSHLYRIEETITAVKSEVDRSSYVKLDLTKWKVQTTLKDLKSLLRQFTYKMSFELHINLQHYIDEIDKGFFILIDVYDCINFYLDHVNQSKYMTHVVSASMNDNQVIDTELNKTVNDLKLMIDLNELTKKYEIALHAFKQHYFPFAAHVLHRFQIPTSMRLNDTGILGFNIINEIEKIRDYIYESSDWNKYRGYIHPKKVYDSNIIGSSPFYVWKHDTIKNEVKRLLNGSEIVITADISKGPSYNAIKFNDIGINFKFHNGAMQRSFTSVLKNFKLTMTMFGNYYYRCGERFYYISVDEEITISYTLNQDEEKNWIDPNDIYTLIHSSHTFLSPYGMWSIKLQSINESVSFNYLNVYANETIDLELVGQGYYIEQNADFNFEVCDKYLDMYYDYDNIV